MELHRAKEILSSLAEGIDPTTGEVLPDNSVCNKGEIVRAFHTILNHLEDKTPKKNMPANAGKPWTEEDNERLKACFESGLSKKELCAEFERSSGSISSRLVRLGLIND